MSFSPHLSGNLVLPLGCHMENRGEWYYWLDLGKTSLQASLYLDGRESSSWLERLSKQGSGEAMISLLLYGKNVIAHLSDACLLSIGVIHLSSTTAKTKPRGLLKMHRDREEAESLQVSRFECEDMEFSAPACSNGGSARM